MSNHSNEQEELRNKIIGLGEKSIRKSYYPELQKRITELEQAYIEIEQKNSELEASKNLIDALFNQAPGAIVTVDLDGNFLFCNDTFKALSINVGIKNLKTFNIFKDVPCLNTEFNKMVKPAFEGEPCKEFNVKCTLNSKNNDEFYFNIIAFPLKKRNAFTSVVLIFEDITERFINEQKMIKLAFFDSLTGLPNRQQVLEKIEERISYSRRYKTFDALMILNIDRFKVINEIHGDSVGDTILKIIGERIRKALREIDFLGRIGADEFAILLPLDSGDIESNSSSMLSAAERLRKILKEAIAINNDFMSLTSSIGITFYPEDTLANCNLSQERPSIFTPDIGTELRNCDTPQEVLRRANTALYRAKEAGGNQTSFFEHTMEEGARERYQLERDLAEASLQSQFELFLQAQVNNTNMIVGAECLIRWNHPLKGVLSPGVFIPIAERTNLIVTIGEWVLRKACSVYQTYFNDLNNFTLSVNISPAHFAHTHFESWITELFSFYSISANKIILEITEGILIENETEIIEKMNRLSLLGFKFSIDDFGTGYSSLAYLKRLPLSEIKIDKSFIQDAPIDSNDAILVETIVAVAKKMGLALVAEGVETKEQFEFLSKNQTMLYQGYYFGKPQPISDFLEIINKSRI